MATPPKLALKHTIVHGKTYFYFRRIPKTVFPFYQQRAENLSGFLQRTLGTSNPKEAPAIWARVHAEVEAEWERIREHIRTASTPQTIDQIDDSAAKAFIWKAWLAWQALGFAASRPMDEFGAWALRVLERLPPDVEFLSARSVRLWHDALDNQPQRRLLTQYATNVIARELPSMVPALLAMPVLDLGRNPAYAEAARKPKMLSEVMDAWYGNHRRKNLKTIVGADGQEERIADKNYDVPFRIARDVLGANTFVSLRHTWTAWMTDAKVATEVQEAIGGWSLSGGARKRYGRKAGTKVIRYEPEALVDDLNRLNYGPLFQEQAPAGWDMAAFERVPTTRG